jgi:hypothetical protein
MILLRRILLAATTSTLLGVALSGCSNGSSASVSASAPIVSLSPSILIFPNQSYGTTSAAETVTLTNTGTAPMTFSGASFAGTPVSFSSNNVSYTVIAHYFTQTNTCGATVAPSASCVISVTFNPYQVTFTTPGGTQLMSAEAGSAPLSDTLTITDNASTNPQIFVASGNAIAPVITLTPATLSFAASSSLAGTLVGTTSPAQSVYLENTGGAPLSISSIVLGGTNATNYAETNNCPATLASLAACTITATFSPTTTSTATASITIASNASNASTLQPITLTGAGVVPSATPSVTSLAFAAQAIGTTSPVQTFTLTDTGSAGGAPLNLTSITLGGANASSFAESNTCGTTLTAGTNCVISVTFDPTTTGSLAATISFVDSASNSPQTIALSGTGTAPVAGLSVSSLAFSTQQVVGTTTAAQTVTLTNTGTGAMNITGISVGGANASSFAETNTCGTSLAANANCVISVTFDPTAKGALAGTIAIADNAPNSPQSVALTGSGIVPVVALSTTSLSYTQSAGSTSATQVAMLTNNGPGTLTIGSIGLTGTNASLFTESNSCGTTLVAEANCTISVSFSPTAAGSFTAAVSIADNGSPATGSIALAGTATSTTPAISLSAPSLSFTQAAESTSAAQTVTLTNSGTAPLLITGIAVTGTNAWNFPQTNTCGASIAVNGTCTISVAFNPSLAATFGAQVTISSNAPVAQSIALTGTGTGTLSINTATATDWKISNGLLTLDWNSSTGAIFGVHLTGYTDNLVDTTTTSGSSGQPDGLYMDDTGQGSGTVTSGYSQVGNEYIDWWVTTASNSTNPFTYTQHFIITANDTGFHIYSTVGHSATDIAGSIGQWQYVFRINLSDFTTTYTVNEGLNNLGVQTVPQPTPTVTGNTDPGRVVSNAVEDLHGLTIPTGFVRQFYTKYDYSSYEYLHQEHGIYGANFGAWMVLPYSGTESMVGGPTKQDLIFTNNILMMEALSNHFALNLAYTPPQGVATNRLFGPFYYHFNAFTPTLTTPAQLYSEANTYEPAFNFLYDSDTTLGAASYVASTARGAVAPIIYNGGSATANTAWTVLGDNQTNFQYTNTGRQYWVNQNAAGTAGINGVVPGTYRLSSYVLGQWGEARQDNVVVKANQTTMPVLSFTPENFSNYAPIWTIGTPDRSAHEFLHGHDSSGNDFRDYWGSFNFWQDFAANKGTQIYYATAEGSTPATNDPTQINYVQWGTFDPGLFGGVYSSTDDTTDGYNYVIPSYVNTLSGATGTNGTGTAVPPLTIHFTTTAAQQAQGQYTVLSVGLACAENDVIATLNGQQLIWHAINASDCMVRSGLSGFYQWLALQWNTSLLTAPGQDNVLTIGSNHAEGFTWDALRMEITNTSAAPGVTGWNDYEWLFGSQDIPANDAVPNP